MANLNNKYRARGRSNSDGTPPVAQPGVAQFSSPNFVLGGGVAIFHVATARVVLCYHTREKHWFLPKGRRDVHENCEQGAEREGFEESGYRNRLLPLPLRHRQPQPSIPRDEHSNGLNTEPVWTQLLPLTSSCQYILFWYVAETLPPDLEDEINKKAEKTAATPLGAPYQYPPKCPLTMSMRERLAMEPRGYEPVHHEGTGVDEDEAQYRSELVSVEVARERLGMSTVSADVVRIGWDAIRKRMTSEGLD